MLNELYSSEQLVEHMEERLKTSGYHFGMTSEEGWQLEIIAGNYYHADPYEYTHPESPRWKFDYKTRIYSLGTARQLIEAARIGLTRGIHEAVAYELARPR